MHNTPRDNLRSPHDGRFGEGIRSPPDRKFGDGRDTYQPIPTSAASPAMTPIRLNPLYSTIRLLPSAPRDDRPTEMADNGQVGGHSLLADSSGSERLGFQKTLSDLKGRTDGMTEHRSPTGGEGGPQVFVPRAANAVPHDKLSSQDKLVVSQDALRKLVLASHERDVLLQTLQDSRASSKPVEQGVTWGTHQERVALGSGGAEELSREVEGSPQAEAVLVREMRMKLEEAVEVAQRLQQDKIELSKALQDERKRAVGHTSWLHWHVSLVA